MLSTTPVIDFTSPHYPLKLIKFNQSKLLSLAEYKKLNPAPSVNNHKIELFAELSDLRRNLLEKSYDCKAGWELLRTFIVQYYPQRYVPLMLKLISSDVDSIHPENNIHVLQAIYRQVYDFIKENELIIEHSALLPDNFCKTYKHQYKAFLKAYKAYQTKIEDNKQSSKHRNN